MKKYTITLTLKQVVCVLAALIFFLGIGYLSAKNTNTSYSPEKVAEEVKPDTLNEWTILQMAIIMTESQFNPKAVGSRGDWGIFQITDIYSKEVNRILKNTTYSHEDAFDIQKSIEMFEILQDYYNPDQNTDIALRYHNRASWYAKRVKANILFIRRMEEVRKALKENQCKSI